MRVFEHPLRVSVPVRLRAGGALQGALVATLLLAFAASAQEEAPGAPPEPDAAAESVEGEAGALDEAGAAPESGVEPDAAAADEVSPELAPPEIPVPDAEIEEILVTGERAVGTPQDAPISAVGFDADVMLKEGIRDIRDLSNFTPSLEIKSAFAASNPTIFIRGVGLDDFNANAASAVAIYQDGVYMASPAGQLFQFFDVEGVEVLRGPQGSLYRNASAGAILVNSRKPTDEFEAFVTATYGNYNNVEVISAVSGPIIADWLSGRLSGSWGKRDGVTENRCAYLAPNQKPCDKRGGAPDFTPIVEPGINRYTNDIDAYGARGQLLFRPPTGAETEWLLNIHGGQNFSRAFQYQGRGVVWDRLDPDDPKIQLPKPLEPPKTDASFYKDTDGDPFAGDYDIDGPEELDLWGSNLKGSWRFGDSYELESITAYEWHDRYTRENSDANPFFLLISHYGDTAWQASQELNLRGEWTPTEMGDGNWIVGAYYIQEDLTVNNFYDQSGGVDLIQEYTQLMRNFAVYAHSDYKIQPGCISISCDITVELGLRYNMEYKEFDTESCGTAGGNCAVSLAGRDEALWDGLGGDLSIAWHFVEASNVYFKYARGWKGGHFNGGATGRFDLITPVDPEIVDSFELGLRSLWFDDRLMLNLTGFYYDYQDLQVFQLEQTPAGFPIAKLVNANDALVYGIELDMGATPIEGMNITLNASWVESEYLDFKIDLPFQFRQPKPGGGFFPPVFFTQEFDYSGNPLIAAPRFSATGSIDYRIPLPWQVGQRGLGYVTPRFSFSWKDDVFYDATSGQGAMQNFPTGTFGQKAFWIFNGSLSWLSDTERIEITGWVHNALDTHYKTQSFDLSRGFRKILDAYADPRTFGITVSASF
jgi:iron complex outermembrane receptor protein